MQSGGRENLAMTSTKAIPSRAVVELPELATLARSPSDRSLRTAMMYQPLPRSSGPQGIDWDCTRRLDEIAEAAFRVRLAFLRECPNRPPDVGEMTSSYIGWLINGGKRQKDKTMIRHPAKYCIY